ncbi:unnamed protein product [Leuciscus chuanchicus]
MCCSNQCAAERMSLEEEIKRFRDACVKAQKRSTAAQLCVLQSRREHALRRLRMSVSEGQMIVKHMTEASLSFPSAALLSAIDDWKRHVCDMEDRINRTQMEFDAQMDEVKKGTRLCSLPDICVPSVPTVPTLPAIPPAPVPQSGSQFHGPYGSLPPPRTPTPTGRATPQPPDEPVTRRASNPQPLTVYERLLERLNMMFPHYNRLVLNRFIQEVRSSSGGALDSLTYDDVINRVAQLILDHQENTLTLLSVVQERMNFTGRASPGSDTSVTPPLAHVWKNVSDKHRNAALAVRIIIIIIITS